MPSVKDYLSGSYSATIAVQYSVGVSSRVFTFVFEISNPCSDTGFASSVENFHTYEIFIPQWVTEPASMYYGVFVPDHISSDYYGDTIYDSSSVDGYQICGDARYVKVNSLVNNPDEYNILQLSSDGCSTETIDDADWYVCPSGE